MTADLTNTILSLYSQGLFQAALDEVKALPPGLADDPRMAIIAGQCLYKLGHAEAAADHYVRAAERLGGEGAQLRKLAYDLYKNMGNREKAVALAEHILQDDPRHLEAALLRRNRLFELAMLDELKLANAAAARAIAAGDEFATSCELPLSALYWCDDESTLARLSNQEKSVISPQIRLARRTTPHVYGDKVRIGYLSGDFTSNHAVMVNLQGVLERHNRNRFEIILYCYTKQAKIDRDNGSRARMGTIKRVADLSTQAASDLIRSDGIDILVDLQGHTQDARIDLVNSGLAPIQVAWLGFPCTGTGIDCDYVIGDPIVTPDSSKPFYHEKLCRLPETYEPNDNINRPLPPPAPRTVLELPEDKFIFASFNNIRKISPQTADAWLSIFREVPDSVMCLLCGQEHVRDNLRAYFTRQGLSADRLIFVPPLAYASHLARVQTVDLVLDSFPYCGHTTTSDCLWAGVPVLALKGRSFASRVSESLLAALDIPELVAPTVEAYIAQALDLARNPSRLLALRERIVANRHTTPLFDTDRFTHHLEDAYRMMVARAKAGLEPDHIDVPARSFL
ncbi:hypothetical protein GOZ78_16860 [Agrobacterium vitis]|uniref:O-GlcNAc transferase C-terminal domain-containing protein n=1 Tax=Agrobacterium vitis TaxID=373 RepID=A0ABD6GH47_AGRVI|nr:glycosyltransferase family 41 protein [Agrobacterium vitis]MUO79263.1 hypothetical protein [Agrobacterium vitis]MUO95581.1 hypothetical protein [Agrobacterium vitis]MUP05849.1 hypothetical protein [Agrobacterium vitis]MUZ82933.1 hypothetical protein [Agrobacterium vitis]MVA11693.1 hypothetical protein [Agrobacterium vitis]